MTLSSNSITKAGNYVFTASYPGDPARNTAAVSSGCNADREHETAAVLKRTTSVTTDAGGPYTLGANGIDLSDKATLSGGTNDAVGSLTFSLYSDAGCQTLVGGPVTATENPLAHGANGFQYTSQLGSRLNRWDVPLEGLVQR